MDFLRWIEAGAAITTAVGVFLAWWQIRLTQRQAVTQFEDQLSEQYRTIAQELPVEALLGEEVPEERYRQALARFYHYIDLSNEQVFLRQQNRIRRTTWDNWADGIRGHLARPAFRRAWNEIKSRAPNSFEELRRLEAEGFALDPRNWKSMASPPQAAPATEAAQLQRAPVTGV